MTRGCTPMCCVMVCTSRNARSSGQLTYIEVAPPATYIRSTACTAITCVVGRPRHFSNFSTTTQSSAPLAPHEPLTFFLPRSGSSHQAPVDCIPAHSPYPPRTFLDLACRPSWSIGRAQRSCEPCRALGQTSNSKLAIILEIDQFLRRMAAESMWPSSSVPPRPDQRFAPGR